MDSRNLVGSSVNYTYYFNMCVTSPLFLHPPPPPNARTPPPPLFLSCQNVNTATTRFPFADWVIKNGAPWLTSPCSSSSTTYPPPICPVGGWNCSTTAGGTGDSSNPYAFQYGPAPAFQVSQLPVPPLDYCHRLGAQIVPGSNYGSVNYKLIDTTNPSRGVGIQYTGGDPCGSMKKQRSLTVWMQCDEKADTTISQNEVVLESASCAYEIFLKTAFGCPAECPVGSFTDPVTNKPVGLLCSNHGFCDFDSSANKPKCFCNDGWGGTDCGQSLSAAASGLSSTGGVLLAVCLFLVGTLGFLGFLWYRIRSLRLDPAAYSALRAGPEFKAGDGNLQEA
jgi:hypothetical protein